ncbi:MAG: PepSY-associated TM helix domain-containing protein, partial [Pseudomonadota bacterium]
ASMNWLHTWLGIALSGVLFAIFWMGTLTVFHLEINRWMMPELRAQVNVDAPLDPVIMPLIEASEPEGANSIFIRRASEREPLVRVFAIGGGERSTRYLHPETGELVERTNSFGASDFFYPFHYSLHISWLGLGYWIVGLAAMAMLVLTISGIFIHRKIFQDFFTFRPQKKARRSTLDLHNLTAIVALPFHILFPLSGVLIFALIYFPNAMTDAYGGDRSAYIEENSGFYTTELIGEPGPFPTSLDSYVARAEAVWTERDGQPARADGLRIANLGDAGSEIVVQHVFPERKVAMSQGAISYSIATSEMVKDFQPKPIQNASAYLEGAHFIRFDSWIVRWLFFFGGLAGSTMIATGLLFWMRARIRKGMEPASVRVVRALTIGTTTGIIAASTVFLIANRVLPSDAAALGLDRSLLEVAVFYAVWIISFIHAGLRNKRAWKDQAWVIAGASLLAMALNWATTGDNLFVTLSVGDWAVAGVDLTLFASFLIAAKSALHLGRVQARDPEFGLTAARQNPSTVAAE